MSELNTFKKERMNKMAMIWRKTVLGYYTHTHTHILTSSVNISYRWWNVSFLSIIALNIKKCKIHLT